MTFLTLARMQRELEVLLGRKVDLVPKDGLKPSFVTIFWPPHECCMRREPLYLQDILGACDMIQTFLAGLDASAFLASELA